MMSDGNPFDPDSLLPKAIGFFVGFMTLGIGILRSVQPFELTVRVVIVAAVSWFAVKTLRKLLYWMSEQALNVEDQEAGNVGS